MTRTVPKRVTEEGCRSGHGANIARSGDHKGHKICNCLAMHTVCESGESGGYNLQSSLFFDCSPSIRRLHSAANWTKKSKEIEILVTNKLRYLASGPLPHGSGLLSKGHPGRGTSQTAPISSVLPTINWSNLGTRRAPAPAPRLVSPRDLMGGNNAW